MVVYLGFYSTLNKQPQAAKTLKCSTKPKPGLGFCEVRGFRGRGLGVSGFGVQP